MDNLFLFAVALAVICGLVYSIIYGVYYLIWELPRRKHFKKEVDSIESVVKDKRGILEKLFEPSRT